jgi:hypothetical protein
MNRMLRLIPPLIILVLLGVTLAFVHVPAPATAKAGNAPAAAISAGISGGGKNAFETVARIDQNGGNFLNYGYMSYISGLSQSALYSSSNPVVHGVGDAYFTFYSTATLTSRDVISSVFTIDSVGVMNVYYQAYPSANFNDPNSFTNGTLIAKFNLRGQNVLNVQGPGKGVASGIVEMEQTLASPFTFGANTLTLGQVGLLLRGNYNGEGTLLDPITPKSFTVEMGNAVVTGPGYIALLPLVRRSP